MIPVRRLLVLLVAMASPIACSGGSSGGAPGATGGNGAGTSTTGDAGHDGAGSAAGDAGDSGAGRDGSAGHGGDGGTTADAEAGPTGPVRGATVPYVEYEAEDGATNGTVLGPSRAVDAANVFDSIAGESSGRRAVKLAGSGQYVRFKTTSAANSAVVRFVIPDSADGTGASATLGLYVNGARVTSLALGSKYAWAYGDAQTTDATTNAPSDGHARHFYDEARVLLPQDVPAGATVALQQDATDTAAYYVVDLVDLEEVPAAFTQPAGTVSVATCGATGNGTSDDGQAIQTCIDQAQGSGQNVWIPAGTYLDAGTVLNVKNVAVFGAGMWRTTLTGASARFACGGTACRISDLALLGDVTLRNDGNSIAGISGDFGSGSQLENVWIEHFTTGAWIGTNGNAPTSGLLVHGARIRDLFADGVNFCNGTSISTVEQSTARNTGDDGFASWAYAGAGDPANTGNTFRFDTVQLPWRANCFAIYGGQGNAVEDSLCADVVTYPGIFVDQEFDAHPFAGTTTIARDTVVRGGGQMFGAQWGALTLSGHDAASPMTGVVVQDVDLQAATYAGVLFIGPSTAMQGVTLDGVSIESAGSYGIQVASSASGSATASDVVVTGAATGGMSNGAPGAFTLTRQTGDSGW